MLRTFIAVFSSLILSACGTGPINGAYCEFCSVKIGQITADGGIIFVESANTPAYIQQANQLALANCQYRNLGIARVQPAEQTNPFSMDRVRYSCVRPQPAYIPTNTSQNQPADNLSSAKSKCSDLGFKPGTDGFGKCILRITK